MSEIFRKEALEAHSGARREGQILRLAPSWTRWTYWLLLGAALGTLLYSVLGTVGEYAGGPAVIRVEGRTDLTARSPGTVSQVAVQPGQRVDAGRLLVTFYAAEETAELERIRREFDLELLKLLQSPGDQAARQALISLRAARGLAETRLGERSIRAPSAGVISDIRIRAGQHLNAGDVILSLTGDDARFSVVAMLPGHYRPQLRRGARLKLELSGYPYAYQHLVIDSIGDEIVGPEEVRRFLGQELGDTIRVAGPVVLVKAHLPRHTFVASKKRYTFFDGMQGTAEVRVRTEPIIVALIPGLRPLFGS